MKLRYPVIFAAVLLAACRGAYIVSSPSPDAGPASAPASGAAQPMSPADPRPTAQVGTSLYARLGGVDAIRAVVHDFVGRVGADTRINAFFRGVDLANLERLLTEQICSATGGPCTYSGRSMRVTHTGLNIGDADFNALVEDLVAALERFNVQPAEKGELLRALGGMKGDIVGH
jgi:hemoglobin